MTDYSSNYTETRHIHSRRTRANLLRDHVVDHARVIFDNRQAEGIYVIETPNGLFCVKFDGKALGIEGCIIVRFKKLDKRKQTRNILTKQAINFSEQKVIVLVVQPRLLGLVWHHDEPEKTHAHLNAGYIPNDLWTDFEGLFVTFPNGRYSIEWFVNMVDEETGERTGVIELPLQTEIESEAPRVKAPGTQEKKKAGTDESDR